MSHTPIKLLRALSCVELEDAWAVDVEMQRAARRSSEDIWHSRAPLERVSMKGILQSNLCSVVGVWIRGQVLIVILVGFVIGMLNKSC